MDPLELEEVFVLLDDLSRNGTLDKQSTIIQIKNEFDCTKREAERAIRLWEVE